MISCLLIALMLSTCQSYQSIRGQQGYQLDHFHKEREWREAGKILDAVEPSVKEVPLPPQELVDAIGGGDGHYLGGVNFQIALTLGNLNPGSRVLEPGCGFGRNARWIGQYLNKSGRYDGFDLVPKLVLWGEKNLYKRNVHFHLASVGNHHYHNWLRVEEDFVHKSAEDYRFPYENGSFDLIFNPSVFTHLLRPVLENYLRECFRVMTRNGKGVFWFFILDSYSKEQLTDHKNSFPDGLQAEYYDSVSWALPIEPEAMIAFDENYLQHTLESIGFRNIEMYKGCWRDFDLCMQGGGRGTQDIIVVEKP